VYLLRDKRLQQLTHDHSWVGEQVRAGLLTNEDAQRHPWRNVVTRAISGADDPEVETSEVVTQSGDLLMICSDGLSSVVSLEEIENLLTSQTPAPRDSGTSGPRLESAATALIEAANKGGGPDNITVILVQVP